MQYRFNEVLYCFNEVLYRLNEVRIWFSLGARLVFTVRHTAFGGFRHKCDTATGIRLKNGISR